MVHQCVFVRFPLCVHGVPMVLRRGFHMGISSSCTRCHVALFVLSWSFHGHSLSLMGSSYCFHSAVRNAHGTFLEVHVRFHGHPWRFDGGTRIFMVASWCIQLFLWGVNQSFMVLSWTPTVCFDGGEGGFMVLRRDFRRLS